MVDRSYLPRGLGNTNFGPNAALILTRNLGRSSYHALQSQFQRRLSKGFQANASYTWAHSIDNATSNFTVTQLTRGDSDFDIRHNFQAALSYDIPGSYENKLASALLKHWAIDGRFSARSALPVNIIGATGTMRLFFDFGQFHQCKGEKQFTLMIRVLRAAEEFYNVFEVARDESGGLSQGNLGRNTPAALMQFKRIWLYADFSIGENFKVQFRAESFNIQSANLVRSITN